MAHIICKKCGCGVNDAFKTCINCNTPVEKNILIETPVEISSNPPVEEVNLEEIQTVEMPTEESKEVPVNVSVDESIKIATEEPKKSIIRFIPILLLLIAVVVVGYFVMNNKKDEEPINEYTPEAIVEEIDYEQYALLRLKSDGQHAIVIWKSDDEISNTFLEEVAAAFDERTSIIYTIDVQDLEDTDYSRIIDDVTAIMKHKDPQVTVPTLIVMSNGKVVFTQEGLMYRGEIADALDENNIE